MRKKISLLLAFAVCFGLLTGCSRDEEKRTASEDAPARAEPSVSAEPTRYRAQYSAVTDERLTSALQNAALCGDDLFCTALGVLEDRTPEGVKPEWKEQYWVYGPILCRLSADGSVDRVNYTPESEASEKERDSIVFERLCAGQDGMLWLLEKHTLTKLSAGEGTDAAEAKPETAAESLSRDVYYLTGLHKDGTRVARFRLDNLESHARDIDRSDGGYTLQIYGIAVDGKGRICLSVSESFSGKGSFFADNRICILDSKTGAAVQTVSLSASAEHLAALSDGRIAVSTYDGGKPVVGILNEKTSALECVRETKNAVDSFAAGPDSGNVFYSAGDSLYRLNLEDGEVSKVLGWTQSDVMHTSADSFCILNDRRIAALHGKETSAGIRNELVVLSPDADGGSSGKQVLRLAVLNLYPFTSEMVIRFNRTNPDYRIEVTDYAESGDSDGDGKAGWNAGVSRLQTEIIAGNAPDLIDISLLSADRFGASGLLTDLYPLIDADPELKRSDLNEHVLSAFEEKGKLYQTVSNFYILTTAGLSERVGDQMGWTMEGLQKAMQTLRAENPESTVFDRFVTADDVLTFLLYLELEGYVNWSTSECTFDSDSFIRLLEFVGSFPTSFNWEAENPTLADMDSDTRILEGKQLLKQCNFNRFEDAQANTAGFGAAKCSFVGYPTENGYGSMFAQIGNSFAITSSCRNRDAAWQFVRQFFLPEYQEQFKGFVFPTNLAVYQDMKQDAMTAKYARNPDGSYVLNEDGSRKEAERDAAMVNGQLFRYRLVSEEEAALVETVIQATTRVLRMDESIKAIIAEGAAPFFAGQRSAGEAARMIQSKAALYVNEQK